MDRKTKSEGLERTLFLLDYIKDIVIEYGKQNIETIQSVTMLTYLECITQEDIIRNNGPVLTVVPTNEDIKS